MLVSNFVAGRSANCPRQLHLIGDGAASRKELAPQPNLLISGGSIAITMLGKN